MARTPAYPFVLAEAQRQQRVSDPQANLAAHHPQARELTLQRTVAGTRLSKLCIMSVSSSAANNLVFVA